MIKDDLTAECDDRQFSELSEVALSTRFIEEWRSILQ